MVCLLLQGDKDNPSAPGTFLREQRYSVQGEDEVLGFSYS